jgi:hypothetical protein
MGDAEEDEDPHNGDDAEQQIQGSTDPVVRMRSNGRLDAHPGCLPPRPCRPRLGVPGRLILTKGRVVNEQSTAMRMCQAAPDSVSKVSRRCRSEPLVDTGVTKRSLSSPGAWTVIGLLDPNVNPSRR